MIETTELPAVHTLRVAACLSVLIPSGTNGRRPKDPLHKSIPGDGPAAPELRQVVGAAIGQDLPSHHDGWQTNLAYLRSALRRWASWKMPDPRSPELERLLKTKFDRQSDDRHRRHPSTETEPS